MVESQLILERSIWSAINDVAVNLGVTIDPNKYQPISPENKTKLDEDIAKLKKYIAIYGTGNSQSKGQKITPRIVINARGFYPGSIGLPKVLLEKQVGVGYTAIEEPYETLDQLVDIHLVASNQDDMRLLHQILFWSIPQRGYIKPYDEDAFLFSGNIFVELSNFYDNPNTEVGLMEKVYQFNIYDCLLEEKESNIVVTPIKDINLTLEDFGYDLIKLASKVNSQ